jgi:integrase
VIPEDPAAAVKGDQKEAAAAKKRAFTLDELRAVLDVADPEWKSMSLFGLYTGQRLADIATMRWSNVDLVKGEIRLTTRKTDKVMILPIAPPLRRYLVKWREKRWVGSSVRSESMISMFDLQARLARVPS